MRPPSAFPTLCPECFEKVAVYLSKCRPRAPLVEKAKCPECGTGAVDATDRIVCGAAAYICHYGHEWTIPHPHLIRIQSV